MMQIQRKNIIKRICLILVLGVLLMLFFIGGPDYYTSRSFKSLWNLGHILFFSLLPLLVFNAAKIATSLQKQFILLMLVTISLGTLIELLQTGFDARIPDMGDIFRDIIGTLVGMFFILPSRKNFPKKQLVGIQSLVLLLIVLQIVPIANAFWDEKRANRQFPLLSGFETPFERLRWTGGATFEVQAEIKKSGDAAMKVMMNTDTYSGVALNYFPGDWEGYRFFQFSVLNPDNDVLKITCRIHDRRHTQGQQEYTDRFNRSFSILHGWQTITIPLSQVRTAPENRQMDMQHIQGVGIFAVRLPHPRTIYIDDVRLRK